MFAHPRTAGNATENAVLPTRRNWFMRSWVFLYSTLQQLRKDALEALDKRVPTPLPSSERSRRSGVERSRGVRILVIDGGGSRGVVASTILLDLEKKLSQALGEEVFLADHFDLVCGTSAGGLIALSHAQSRIKLSGIQDLFASGIVFQLAFGWMSRVRSWLWEKGPYSEGPLQELLSKTFPAGDTADAKRLDGGSEGRKQRLRERHGDFDEKRPRVFVVSTPIKSTRLMLFTNYPSDEYTRESTLDIGFPYPIASHVPATQAARATSAAPTYFPPAKVDVHPKETVLVDQVPLNDSFLPDARWSHFWDGGLVDNSPVQLAITQAQMLFGHSVGIDLVVSVGCGKDEKREVPTPARPISWSTFLSTLKKSLIDAITNSEHSYSTAVRALATDPQYQELTRGRMFRLNPTMPYKKLGVGIDESDPQILKFLSQETSRKCAGADKQLSASLKAIVDLIVRVDGRSLQVSTSAQEQTPVQIFEASRAKALDALKRLPATFISWDSTALKFARKLEGRTSETEKDDSRYFLPSSMNELLRDRYTPSINTVIDFLEAVSIEMGAVGWARARLDENDRLAADIEAARFGLARNVLYPLIKFGKSQHPNYKLSHEFLEAFGLDTVYRILQVILPLDYANCILVMSLRRNDPHHPRGMVWIHSADFNVRPGRELNIWPDPDRGYTISDSYLDIFHACEGIPSCKMLYELLAPFMTPRVPQWMRNQYPDELQAFGVGTGDPVHDFSL